MAEDGGVGPRRDVPCRRRRHAGVRPVPRRRDGPPRRLVYRLNRAWPDRLGRIRKGRTQTVLKHERQIGCGSSRKTVILAWGKTPSPRASSSSMPRCGRRSPPSSPCWTRLPVGSTRSRKRRRDYRFVVRAERAVVAEAVAKLVAAIDYEKHIDSLHLDFGAKPGYLLWLNRTGLQVATVRD